MVWIGWRCGGAVNAWVWMQSLARAGRRCLGRVAASHYSVNPSNRVNPASSCSSCTRIGRGYMLNTRSEGYNTVFYSYLACFVNTVTLNMYGLLSNTAFTRRNTLVVLVWRSHRNTWIPIQHVGSGGDTAALQGQGPQGGLQQKGAPQAGIGGPAGGGQQGQGLQREGIQGQVRRAVDLPALASNYSRREGESGGGGRESHRETHRHSPPEPNTRNVCKLLYIYMNIYIYIYIYVYILCILYIYIYKYI